jgi:branched-chain amino acid transport system permease protein
MLDLIFGYLTIGLVNGSFYVLLSLGLALVFGLLNVLNMTHGALYMVGAFLAWASANYLGLDYLTGLVAAAGGAGALGLLIERGLLRRTYALDPLFGFMLTFGLAMVIQGLLQVRFGSTGLPFSPPRWLSGGIDLGFIFFPAYRLWVVAVSLVVCLILWGAIERTRTGSLLRAASENRAIAEALGLSVPKVFTVTFGLGAALAGLAGGLAAPIYQVSPLMGSDILLVVFAIIVVGGMGSIRGTILSGYGLALIESVTQALYPQAANMAVFAFMCLVLAVRPKGLFGISVVRRHQFSGIRLPLQRCGTARSRSNVVRNCLSVVGVAFAVVALPCIFYPIYLVKILCFAIFATSFNFLLGFAGIVSFGQAALFGTAAYVTAQGLKVWALPPELALSLGVGAAVVLGLVMGALAIRRRGIYQAMITLAVAQMVYFAFLQADFVHGEDGIQAVPRGRLFGLVDLRDDRAVYALTAVALIAVFFVLRRLLASRFGMILVAIRDDERRALSLGYDVSAIKLAAFGIASACAGLAGSLSAIAFQLATLSGVHWQLSGEAVLMALVGGIGTLSGPLLGAVVLVTMQHFLAPFGAWILVIQGAVFVVCVLIFREGLLVRGREWFRRAASRITIASSPGKQVLPERGR